MLDQAPSVSIGQEDSAIQSAEAVLNTDGALALETIINVDLPWTKLPVISTIVNLVVEKLVSIFITEIDREAFASYVAIKTGKEVSDYIQAQTSGETSAIDQSGDALIHLGKI